MQTIHPKPLEETLMHRDDFEIRRDIECELQWDPGINDKRIGVIVDNGVVTLTGEVEYLAARCAAEEIAKRIGGVRAIANEIKVRLVLSGVRSDTEIALAAANALRWHVATCNAHIKPVVQNGWITLKGHVPFAFQKAAAGYALRHLIGVEMLVNDLTVGEALSASEDVAHAARAVSGISHVENRLSIE
jgi:osmotically-inducible protein OsmY